MDPWKIQHDVPLAPLTTFEVGGSARYLVAINDLAWLPAVLAWAKKHSLETLFLGGGSNVIVSDAGWPGLVVHMLPKAGPQDLRCAVGPTSTQVFAPANMVWDTLVAATAQAGLWGLACLSGIPGLVGAAPLQNIGAYGQALADTLVCVDVVDVAQGSVERLAAEACGFGYRQSHFKGRWRQRYVITGLTVCLQGGAAPAVEYAELRTRLGLTHGKTTERLHPKDLRQAVVQLRRDKSMLWDRADPNHRSVGSFFVNPRVTWAYARQLQQQYAGMPVWPAGEGVAKLSAAWLIEAAGFAKGWADGRVGLSTRHSLALINRGGATAAGLVEAAAHIRTGVAEVFNVTLTPEPTFCGFDAPIPPALAAPVGATACAGSATT